MAIIQHGAMVPPGCITEVLSSCKVDHFVFHAWGSDNWPSASELRALVVLGGRMNVDQMAEFPFLRKSRDLMAAAIDRNLPTLGVCLGSQMMARVMGIEVRRAESKNACFSLLELTNEGQRDPIISPFSDVPVLQFHEDTFATPDGAELLATSTSSGLVQAFRYGDRAYAVQFHFEVDSEILERWCRLIGDNALISEWGISKPDLFAQASRFFAGQREAGTLMLERFLELSSDD